MVVTSGSVSESRNGPVTLGAPYEYTGVVTEHMPSWRDWSILPLTKYQYFYLFVLNAIGAGILSGAANFGVACAMYRTADKPIRIWPFSENTIAGDMGVTVVLQQLITMLITSSLCNHDVRHGVKALEHPWPPLMNFPANPTPAGSYLGTDHPKIVAQYGKVSMGNATNKSRVVQFAFWFIRAMCTGSERNAFLLRGLTIRQRIERLLWTAAQGLWIAVLSFWWFWPIGIAIVSPIWEHDDLRGTWTPPLIKLVYGALLGLLTNPFIALLTLGAECNVRRTHPDKMIWSQDARQDLIAKSPMADKAVLQHVEVE